MATAISTLDPRPDAAPIGTPIHWIGAVSLRVVLAVGDLVLFALRMLGTIGAGLPRRAVFLPVLYQTGVSSLPVVLVTGTFIGMVLAVQSYDQFRMMHLENRLGAVITIALVKELGPVLSATMLAGRIGSAMAAELGTMRVTEQIDALRALGADPVRHLVLPRFLACVLLVPLLTAAADAAGMTGGWFFGTQVLGINTHHYWYHTLQNVTAYDVSGGLFKSCCFGATIAVVSCHRGFGCGAGAEGVGRAATEAFVLSFVLILAFDFVLGIAINDLYYLIWPSSFSLA